MDDTRAAEELAQFKSVAEHLPHLAWSCRPSGYCDYLSRRWEEFTGAAASEHHGRGWLTAVHHDDQEAVRAAWEAFIHSNADYDVDYRLRRHDGKFFWFKTRGIVMRGGDGRPLRVFGTTTDIDAQKVAEERLREADERAAFVRRASGVGFWYCDLPFDVLEWDALVKEHFHLAPDEQVTIETFYERIHPDDRATTKAAIDRSITQRTGYDVHYRTVHPQTQSQKWIRAIGRTFYGPDGAPECFDGVTLDVSAQRHAELRQQFMADLAAATQPLTDAEQVTAVAARLLADHLNVDRCAYAAIEDEAIYVITGDFVKGVPSIVGRWPIAAFGAEHFRLMLSNEPFVVHDVQTETRIEAADRPAYLAATIGAVVCIPLHKDGKLTAAMAVHQSVPRQWTVEEVDLIKNVVAYCWEALERTRATRLLGENEEQLRIITDSVPALIAFVDTAQKLRFVNRQYEAWFGLPRDSCAGCHLQDVVGRAAYEALQPHVERALAGEMFEADIFAPFEKKKRHIHAAFVPRFDGDSVVGCLSLITDVTERMHAEEKVRASEQRFREMADTAPVALWLTDIDGSCTFLSREWYEYTGQTQEEALGLGWTTATHPEDQQRAEREFVAANSTQGTFRTEYRLRRYDGSYRWAIDTGRPRFSFDGKFLGMVGAVFDIEDRKQAETALREADQKKDDFLALLAHELRSPLAPLRNGLQVMRLAGTNGQAAEQVRGMMERQLGHMVRLIDDLLDVSRISRNKMELRRERILLSDVIASAIETAKPAMDAASHEFIVTLPPAPVYMNADLTRLAQVVSNLLTNAAKYTASGGRIVLSAVANSEWLTIAVQDNGIGIPQKSLPSIFDMFSQVDRSLERSTGGLGIGLALVKGLVEMHGGHVTAESEGDGLGSTFTVVLPCEVLHEGPLNQEPPVSAPVAGGPSHRVLVVDDNRDSAVTMGELLKILGHDVRLAYDGREAVDIAQAFRPAVILMDIGMPHLNGYDATRAIRSAEWGKGMTIVAATGWGQQADRDLSREAGFDGHLVKPVRLDDILPFFSRGNANR